MRSRSSRLPRSRKMRVVKNYQKPCVFTWFPHASACAHSFQIVRKSFPTRLSNKSRDRSLSKDCFFELPRLKSLPGRPPGCFWRPLGALLSYLGRSWATLGALLGALGTLLGRSWALLERSWGGLGTLLAALGTLFGALGTLLDPPGQSWIDFGASCGRFGTLQLLI